MLGFDKDLTFVHTEMTLAATVPQLAQFKELGVQSRLLAQQTLEQLASVP